MLYTVTFWLYIESKLGRELCYATLFATSFDDAESQIKEIFGSYKKFEVFKVEKLGQPGIPDAKELRLIS